MELSKKVKALRKKQGLSQLELAEKIFVSRQAISGWEAGTSRPSTENLQCLSKLYAVPLEVLLDDKQELEFGGDKQSEPVIPQKQRKKKCVSSFLRERSKRFSKSIRITETTAWIASALRLSRTALTSAGGQCIA